MPVSTSPAEFLQAIADHRDASLALSQNGARFIPGDDRLVMTFPSYTEDDGAPRPTDSVWGGSFLRTRGFSVLGFNHQRSNWYRAEDLHRLMRQLQSSGSLGRFRQVVMYGGSMGGYAALAFAELMPGCIVVAHNPQTTLKKSLVPWEKRFRAAQQYDWRGDFADAAVGARLASRVYVSYDPFEHPDRRHIERLWPGNLVRLRVPMVGHQVPVWLQQMRLLDVVFDGAVDSSLTEAHFAKLARARFELPHYLMSLASKNRRPALKRHLAEKARGLAPQLPGPKEFLWNLAPKCEPRLERPLLVWTLAGGGRRFADIVTQLRGDVTADLEPFNGANRPNDLTQLLAKPGYRGMVLDEIDRVLASAELIVHRVTPGSGRFDVELLEKANRRHFRHVILHQRDALARWQKAEQRVATSPAEDLGWLISASRRDLSLLVKLQAAIDASGCDWIRLAAESLEHVDREDRSAILALSAWLDLTDRALQAGLAAAGDEADPPRINRPPTLRQTEELSWIPGLDQGLAVVRPLRVQRLQPSCVVLDSAVPVFLSGEALLLSGLAVPPPDQPGLTRLRVQQGGRIQECAWGQASPGGPAQFPGRSEAANARFAGMRVRADPEHPVSLLASAPDGTSVVELLQLSFEAVGGRRAISGLYLAPWSLGLRPLPGVASLSLCTALHRLLLDHLLSPVRLPPEQQRRAYYEYRATDISGAALKFAVLRDPVERLVSLLGQPLELQDPVDSKLSRQPGPAEFIEAFADYMRIPSVARRFASQCELLVAPASFTKLFRLDRLSALAEELLRCTGQTLELSTYRPRDRPRLDPRLVRRIRDCYADDQQLLETHS